MLIMILVITKHLKNYLEIFIIKKTTIVDVEGKQDELSAVISVLDGYAPRDNKCAEAKNKLLDNAKKFYIGREKIIQGFKNKVFSLYYDEIYEQMKAAAEEE